MIAQRIDLLRTLWRLGPINLARVASYRLGINAGLHPALRLSAKVPEGAFYSRRTNPVWEGAVVRSDWRDEGFGFGHISIPAAEGVPDWHANILGDGRARSDSPWHRLTDFDGAVGDIKGVWEVSRFDWLIAMAQRAAMGDISELDRLNRWLANWAWENPPYFGANWKCAQEASIRVLHLALAALLLDQVSNPLPGLIDLLKSHLQRVASTMSYAIAQDNNHGTSEAAALFVGGSWLHNLGLAEGGKWARVGRRRLSERANRLIANDGSFSQHSLVYHRLMLDTYSFAETWRRKLALPDFPAKQNSRLEAATKWLSHMVDGQNGDGPNLGANDGARLFVLEDADYRDFRPSLQWASAIFLNRRAIEDDGVWDQRLRWLEIEKPKASLPELTSMTFSDGGYHVLRQGRAVAYMRFPRFRFRPSQADAMHVDLWVDGENVLRDGGTYTYNGDKADADYFTGTASHNTVMFDDRDQMPRLGRFLFGQWLNSQWTTCQRTDDEQVGAGAVYEDFQGARHERSVTLGNGKLIVHDHLGGKAKQAVLRWRLAPGDWRLSGLGARLGDRMIRIKREGIGAAPVISISEGWESRYYGKRSRIPVLEARVRLPAILVTEVEF